MTHVDLADILPSRDIAVELEDGTSETITLPRVTTRMRFALTLKTGEMMTPDASGAITISPTSHMGITLLDVVLPGLLDRETKIVSQAGLIRLVNEIIEHDGETLFGKDWKIKKAPPETESKPKEKKRPGRPKKPSCVS